MDFGKILESWEKTRSHDGGKKAEPAAPRIDMEAALERYPPGRQVREAREERSGGERAGSGGIRPLKELKSQAVLDLHGMSSLEAEEALDRFIRGARARGLAKVLIVHGKGLHSPGQPVLQRVVQNYLEKCPYTGAFGRAGRMEGGRGATWALIRAAESNARGR